MTNHALELIQQVQSIDIARPTLKTMVEDIKMMNIKVRSVEGDLFSLNHRETRFIRSLWRVSKINQIAHTASKTLTDTEADHFFSYLESLGPEGGFLDQPAPQNMHTLLVEVFRHEKNTVNELN